MIFRRFINLHIRLLLQKQDELRVMEDELQEKDLIDERSSDERMVGSLQCRLRDEKLHQGQGDESRTCLFGRIKETLLEYGTAFYDN
jgi:hypothetical protein